MRQQYSCWILQRTRFFSKAGEASVQWVHRHAASELVTSCAIYCSSSSSWSFWFCTEDESSARRAARSAPSRLFPENASGSNRRITRRLVTAARKHRAFAAWRSEPLGHVPGSAAAGLLLHSGWFISKLCSTLTGLEFTPTFTKQKRSPGNTLFKSPQSPAMTRTRSPN